MYMKGCVYCRTGLPVCGCIDRMSTAALGSRHAFMQRYPEYDIVLVVANIHKRNAGNNPMKRDLIIHIFESGVNQYVCVRFTKAVLICPRSPSPRLSCQDGTHAAYYAA